MFLLYVKSYLDIVGFMKFRVLIQCIHQLEKLTFAGCGDRRHQFLQPGLHILLRLPARHVLTVRAPAPAPGRDVLATLALHHQDESCIKVLEFTISHCNFIWQLEEIFMADFPDFYQLIFLFKNI